MLDYVYGVTTQGIRSHVQFVSDDMLVYPAAGVGVVLSISSNFQSFFRGHNNDISALAVSKDRSLVATGQIGKRARVCIWDPISLKEVGSFTSLERGVIAVAFDHTGRYVVAVGNDDYHSVAVYDIKAQKQIALQRGERNKVYHLSSSAAGFIMAGHNFARLITINNDAVDIKKVLFGSGSSRAQVVPFPCCAALADGRGILGSSKGELYIMSGNSVTSTVQAHSGPVLTIFADDYGVVSGGRDCTVKLFSTSLKQQTSVKLGAPIRSVSRLPSASSLTTGLAVTLEDGSIYLFDFIEDEGKLIQKCHGTLSYAGKAGLTISEAWGIAVSPTAPEFASVGDDGQLIRYSAVDKKALNYIRLPNVSRIIVTGLSDGRVASFNSETLEKLNIVTLPRRNRRPIPDQLSKQFAECGVSDIKFSPDGEMIACTSHTQDIFVLSKDLQLLHTMAGHTAHVKAFDWDTTSSYLQSMCGGYDYLFWDAKNGKQVTSASFFADKEWATWSLVIGYATKGIFKPAQKGSDINTVAKSNNSDLLVTGTDDGTVELFNFPALHDNQERKMYYGHSAHLTGVVFAPNDEMLFSIGGRDNCILSWFVEE
ncbi:hypothetical protein GEMRC1_009100 [Eukaryota sp. GEM-RC1]